jgi:iron complex transport system substrate-binding protein
VRIVSLLPSTTEILFAVGAGDDVVGVTFECDFPPQVRQCRIVSSTTLAPGLGPAEIDAQVRSRVAAGEDLYRLDEEALRDLDPDLVVTQDLCAVCAVDVANVADALDHLGCRARVLTVDPMTLEDVLASIADIGAASGRETRARRLVDRLRDRLTDVARATADRVPRRVAVLEWPDPPYSAGHWVPDMIAAAGATSALGGSGRRSRRIEWNELHSSAPEFIVVAPCGYDLEAAADLAATLARSGALPAEAPVWAVDANAAFVRPGPRIVDGIEALAGIVHPATGLARPDIARRVA